MDPRTGRIVMKPSDMTDEEWRAKCQAEGLVELRGKDAEDFIKRGQANAESVLSRYNRKARRAMLSQNRKAKKR